jgi:hypothetical protein
MYAAWLTGETEKAVRAWKMKNAWVVIMTLLND